MVGQAGTRNESDVARNIEGDSATSRQGQSRGGGNSGKEGLDLVDAHAFGRVSGQAEQDRAVGAVPAPRRPERAEQVDGDASGGAIGIGGGVEVGEFHGEGAPGPHRADRVRGRRADADAEHVEQGERVGGVLGRDLAGHESRGRGAPGVEALEGGVRLECRAVGGGHPFIHADHCPSS